MPLYEYQCKDCGIRFERMQSFSDAALTVCPECEGTVHRIIGPTGVIFKGSGFYVTDSRKSNSASQPAEKSEKSEKSDKGEKSEKTEKASTPAASTESSTSSSSTDSKSS